MHPLRLPLPNSWTERRFQEAAVESALPMNSDFPMELIFSYYPEALPEWAMKFGVADYELLDLLQADLEQGIAFNKTSRKLKDGSNVIYCFGVHWRLEIHPRFGKNTRQPLAFVNSISPIEIPTNRARVVPEQVSFYPIWDEISCDPRSWLEPYEVYRARYKKITKDLIIPCVDVSVRDRSDIHAMVRRQYSALRVMMDLLHFRSEKERFRFSATVVLQGKEKAADKNTFEMENGYLRMGLNERSWTKMLDEDMLVEVHSKKRSHPKRGRIRSIKEEPQRLIIEIDLPAEFFSPGELVEVQTVSRFGMWAHQQAIHHLLEERVEGYWPDLARLLCAPEKLPPPSQTMYCKEFFCDLEPDRPRLNERQRDAVNGACATPHAFCIQGPPGTGKTTVICEIVQQMVARGERILMVAPTHVAIDEVLRRIGSREGVRALRLSWDDTKIAEDVRKFSPANIIDLFLERFEKPVSDCDRQWTVERENLVEGIAKLAKLRDNRGHCARMIVEAAKADAFVEESYELLDRNEPKLEAQLNTLTTDIRETNQTIYQLKKMASDMDSDTKSLWEQAGVTAKLVGWLGFGSIGAARRNLRLLKTMHTQKEKKKDSLQSQKDMTQNELGDLRKALVAAKDKARKASAQLQKAKEEKETAEKVCYQHPLINNRDFQDDALNQLLEEFQERERRIAAYQRLARRFDELIVKASQERQDLGGLRKDLIAMTNLFCCTTTGVAGSQELRDLVFDTLIVDEASRVTDSEFLIGAVRARRWILVGDENQLPPYVEQQDEHFLHALSALHQANQSGKPLKDTVDGLGDLWEEDEELHRFRRESVHQVADRLHSSGDWDNIYHEAYQTGIDYLKKELKNPSRSLLESMRGSMIHSLFQRVVEKCPPQMKVRLVEQRRMIEPIANIVSLPVYGGDYQTPPAEELERCGITPLTTPSFKAPITFLDTSLLRGQARDEVVRNSFVNRTEAYWIVEACRILDRELNQAGSDPITVSILAFYKAQARLIRNGLSGYRFTRLRFSVIDAIDRIQGQESDVVLLSFCRTYGKNVPPRFGQWLQDVRRLNVACTRAHRALFFVGQKELLSRLCSNVQAVAFYQNLNELFEKCPQTMQVIRQFGGSNS